MKKKLLGFYDYTVILTYCGMISAFVGITRAISGLYCDAVLCLIIAGVCDMFDGAVAATKERTTQGKTFGIQIDSLSDLISFGVLPGIFTYMISGQNGLVQVVAVVYTLCALIRLAYFNVLEEERQRQTAEKRDSYLGVPVTTIAITLPAAYILYDQSAGRNSFIFVLLLLVTAIGFLAPIQIKKPKLIGKICMIVVGALEVIGLLFVFLWGAA